MAELSNARIDELPLCTSLKPTFWGVVRNQDNQITERFSFADILSSATTGTFEWLTDTTYNNLQAVTWKGEWWQAIQNVPVNIIPGTDVTYWIPLNKSGSGFVFWMAGAYPQDDVFVLKKMSADPDAPDIRMFWLKSLTRPYVSSDFNAELVAGDWVQMFVSATPTAGITIKDMGDYNASTNLLPDVSTGVGSGVGGAIENGNEFTFAAAGTIGGEEYPAGTIARAKVNVPGQTLANWRLY